QKPEWIRIDLGAETNIKGVNLVIRSANSTGTAPTTDSTLRSASLGDGVPYKIDVKTSRDNWKWDTAFESNDFKKTSDASAKIPITFEPRVAKQIIINADNLPIV